MEDELEDERIRRMTMAMPKTILHKNSNNNKNRDNQKHNDNDKKNSNSDGKYIKHINDTDTSVMTDNITYDDTTSKTYNNNTNEKKKKKKRKTKTKKNKTNENNHTF